MLENSTGAKDIADVVQEYKNTVGEYWKPVQPPTQEAPANNLVHFIRGEIDTIVVLPAVKGRLEIFDYLLTFLTKIGVISDFQDSIGTIMERVRVIFMSPFYGESTTIKGSNNNLALNYMFMKLKNHNPNKVFYIADRSPDTMAAAASLNKTLSPTGSLLSLLEPSHIRYTGPVAAFSEGILITSSNPGMVPAAKSDIEQYSSFTPGKDVMPANTRILTVNTLGTTAIAGKKGIGQCDTLVSEVDMSGMTNIIGLESGNRIAVIRLLVPPKGKEPLCKKKSILEGAPSFFPADIRSTATAPKTTIYYNDTVYRIRKPLGRVVSNWAAGVFTPGGKAYDGEVDFLNDLGLSPKLLEDVFGETWVYNLTEFLKAVSLSKCFSDQALLTYRECDNARQFIRAIEEHKMTHEEIELPSQQEQTEPKTIPNNNGVVLDPVTPGGFSSIFKIGSHMVYPTLTGWLMPVMIVSKLTNKYILRDLKVNNKAVKDTQVISFLNMYKQMYPDWLFLT
jgi:hypothetical protein